MREEIRMAVIDEEGQLVDFVLERTDESHMANHMYKGTVKNVLNGMQAAFVDIGGSQNAYLNLQQGKEQKILPRLSVGQQVLVQVVKEEMLGKGGSRYCWCKPCRSFYGTFTIFWRYAHF